MIFLLLLFVWFVILEVQVFRSTNFHRLLKPQLYQALHTVPSELQPLVQYGRSRAAQSRIVICGLACNIADVLPSTQTMIQGIVDMFQDYRIVIFENNSRDGTRADLQRWAAADPRVVLLLGDTDHNESSLYCFGSMSPQRMQRMAHYRNLYLQWVKQHASDWEFMLAMDLDLQGTVALDGLAHSLAYEWDAVACNGRGPLSGFFGTVTHLYDFFNLPADDATDSYDVPRLLRNWLKLNGQVRGSKELIPVRSAFNGLALYKIPSILQSLYTGERCEHIGFHDSMRRSGHGAIFIDPLWLMYCRMQGPTSVGQFLKLKQH